MSFALPKPKRVTADEVVLSRDDWEQIVSVLGEPAAGDDLAEDEEDIAAVGAARSEDARFAARVSAKRGGAIETTIPIEVVRAKSDGVHPIRAWRDFRGWTQLHLSVRSGVGRDLIAQIETRRKNGSVETLERLARALDIPIEALIEEHDR